MNTSNKTLWLGNIETWMDINFLKRFLAENNIYPRKISIKSKPTKRGCAFLKFDTHEIAQSVIDNNNGKIYRNIEIKLNWVRNKNRLNNMFKPVKFTVNNLFLFF